MEIKVSQWNFKKFFSYNIPNFNSVHTICTNRYPNLSLNYFVFKEIQKKEKRCTIWNFSRYYSTGLYTYSTNAFPFSNDKKNIIFHKKRIINNNDIFFFFMKRHFGGRSGGLKRKKTKKIERVINTCVGKRLEFFYPPKKRRQRIRLIQNSRKNIVYDNVLKRFLVYYYKQGIQVFRSFSTKKKKNFEVAKNKAIILSKQLDKRYQTKEGKKKENHIDISNSDLAVKFNNEDLIGKNIKVIPDKNKSGYRGIFYDSTYHAYICVYNEAGIRKFQVFKIENNNYLEAYHLAVMCRRYKLLKNFQFVAQRNRMRSGKCYLK